jgi:hypothetical protein
MTHDIVYRINTAGIKAVVCTSDGECACYVDEAQKEAPLLRSSAFERAAGGLA